MKRVLWILPVVIVAGLLSLPKTPDGRQNTDLKYSLKEKI